MSCITCINPKTSASHIPVLSFRCKVCGKEMLKVYGTPQLPERVKCPHCQSTYRVRAGHPKAYPQMSRAALAAVAIAPALVGSILTGVIFGGIPLKTDSPQVKADKVGKLVGGFTASGFAGLVAGLIAAPRLEKRW